MAFDSGDFWARSEFWATIAAAWFGVALAATFSRKLTRRGVWNRFRGWIPIALNLGAFASVAAILLAGTEPGGLGARWRVWLLPASVVFAVSVLAARFPRSAGIPLALVLVTTSWLVIDALRGFEPVETGRPDLTVQPLTAQETVTAFSVRVDLIHVGVGPTLFRVRSGVESPPEWWWPWAASRGWAESIGPRVPLEPLKFGVYRLVLDDRPRWELSKPTLLP